MFEYQTLSIGDFTQGITDEYKSSGTRYSKLENLIIKENGSVRLRNGMMPSAYIGGEIRSATMLGNDIVMLAGTGISIKGDYGSAPPISNAYTIVSNSGLASAHRWRNSVIVCPYGATDKIGRVIKLTGGTYRSELAALPKVFGPTMATGSRLFALCLERTYVDSDGFTYTEYSPELFGKIDTTGTSPNIKFSFTGISYKLGSTAIVNPTEANPLPYPAGSVTLALFVTEPNKTVLYRNSSLPWIVPDSTPAVLQSSPQFPLNANLTTQEVGSFFSEVAKSSLPPCNYFCISKSTGWYAGPSTDNGIKPFRLIQSVQGMPTSIIADAYYDFDSAINGVADLSGTPIVFTDRAVYRVEGAIGIDDSGSIRAVKVTNSEGGISNGSIVSANDKLYYAGTDGLYVTDGYSAQNITGSELYKTYLTYTSNKTNARKISGTFDRDNDIIYWHVGNGIMLALNVITGGLSTLNVYKAGMIPTVLLADFLMPRSGVASVTASTVPAPIIGTSNFTRVLTLDTVRLLRVGESYRPSGADVPFTIELIDNVTKTATVTTAVNTAIANVPIYENSSNSSQHILVGTSAGLLMAMRGDYYSDMKYSSTLVDTPWLNKQAAIRFNMLTSGVNYGSSSISKWVRDIAVNMKTRAKIAVEPYTVREDDKEEAAMKLISNIEQFRAYDSAEIWGRLTSKWYPTTVLTGKRHMPKSFCKSRANQIGLRSVPVQLLASSDYSKLKIDSIDLGGAPSVVATLENKNSNNVFFPYDSDVDSAIYIIKDGVAKQYPVAVKVLSDDRRTLTFSYPNDVDLNVGDLVDWVIEMYPTYMSFDLYSIDVSFALISNSGAGYKRSSNLKDNYGD